MELESIRYPLDESIKFWIPGMLVPITGHPHDIASSIAFGLPS